jgi:hypothetical protein
MRIRIRDPESFNPGSGMEKIRIPDTKHCFKLLSGLAMIWCEAVYFLLMQHPVPLPSGFHQMTHKRTLH